MTFIEGGIFPRTVEIVTPEIQRGIRVTDSKTRRLENYARPQNHSSRDRGDQLKVNPISRTRYGNRR